MEREGRQVWRDVPLLVDDASDRVQFLLRTLEYVAELSRLGVAVDINISAVSE